MTNLGQWIPSSCKTTKEAPAVLCEVVISNQSLEGTYQSIKCMNGHEKSLKLNKE